MQDPATLLEHSMLHACCRWPAVAQHASTPLALGWLQRRRAQEMTRSQMEVEGRTEASPNFALPPSLLRRCAAWAGSQWAAMYTGSP